MSDFTIDCNVNAATRGLELTNDASSGGFKLCSFRNLLIRGHEESGSIGVSLDGVVMSLFENVISRNWETGFDTLNSNQTCSQNTFIRCLGQDNSTHAYYVRNAAINFQFLGCRVEDAGDTSAYGFRFEGQVSTSTEADGHLLLNCDSEDDHPTADFYFDNCRAITMIGGGPGTNTTGDGMKWIKCQFCEFHNVRFAAYSGTGKFALTVDDSLYNSISGYIRDTRNFDAVSIAAGNTRNNYRFGYTSGATSPEILQSPGIATGLREITANGATSVDMREPGTYLCDASSGNQMLTLASSNRADLKGLEYTFKKTNSSANTVTLDPASTGTIDGSSTLVLRRENEWGRIRCLGDSNWALVGRGLAELVGSKTYNPASLANGATANTTVTVTGASVGDVAEAAFAEDMQGVMLHAYVSASDTVTCYFHNISGGTVDLGNHTLRARVRKLTT